MAAIASSPLRTVLAQTRTPVGLQLYCVRLELPKDPAAVLSELKKIGFQPVPHEPYCLTYNGILIFFYIDDIVIVFSR